MRERRALRPPHFKLREGGTGARIRARPLRLDGRAHDKRERDGLHLYSRTDSIIHQQRRSNSALRRSSRQASPGRARAYQFQRGAIVTKLTLAIARGRLQAQTLELLAQAGVRISEEAISSRRLSIEDEEGLYRLIFVKPVDVPVYVEHGIADCGAVGRDVLLESGADLLQPLTLKLGCCRIAVAAMGPSHLSDCGMLRVATKYPRIAERHFGSRGVPVEIIELSGSVELAPVLGLADCIVDLVETGRTLRENGLHIVEVIDESTGRLVVNRASCQRKALAVSRLIGALKGDGGRA